MKLHTAVVATLTLLLDASAAAPTKAAPAPAAVQIDTNPSTTNEVVLGDIETETLNANKHFVGGTTDMDWWLGGPGPGKRADKRGLFDHVCWKDIVNVLCDWETPEEEPETQW